MIFVVVNSLMEASLVSKYVWIGDFQSREFSTFIDSLGVVAEMRTLSMK